MRKKLIAQQGFTLIELMIVVAIIGILAAVAVPMFTEALSKAKRTEAVVQLENLGKTAVARYNTDGGYPTVNAALTPASDCCTQNFENKRKCEVKDSEWNTPEWRTLDFSLNKPFQFQYSYTSNTPSAFNAYAVGKPNCDKAAVTYTNVGDTFDRGPRTRIINPE